MDRARELALGGELAQLIADGPRVATVSATVLPIDVSTDTDRHRDELAVRPGR